MTKRLITLHADDSLNIVSKTFEKHKFHHIPIIEHGKLAGILSKTDLLRLLSVRDQYSEQAFKRIRARDFMTSNVITVRPDDTVGLAADMFLTNDLHALPVVDDGELVGIVTTHDLLKYAYAHPS